jgi:transcriptional regulator with XRE-family HTH domain
MAESSYNTPFAVRLRDLLKQKGVTNKTLADYISASQQAVNLYTAGTSQPTVGKLVKIAEFFKVSLDYLVGLSDISSQDIAVQGMSKRFGLSEQAIEVLSMYGKETASNSAWAKHREPLPQTSTELELKALNHIIANCDGLLTVIGLYWFGEFTGLEDVKVDGISIGIKEPQEFMKNAMLKAVEVSLANYRKKLLDNGGDLPLTIVLDEIRKDKRERFLRKRVEFLANMRGHSLTEAEIQHQRDLHDNGK